jgi:hypothetical protein
MSDEPKKSRGRWLDRVVAALVVMASYETVHYATAERGFDRGGGGCMGYRTHKIGRKDAPAWVDDYVFWPAAAIDAWLGFEPSSWTWH